MRLAIIAAVFSIMAAPAISETLWPEHFIDTIALANLITLQQNELSDAQTYTASVIPPGGHASFCSTLINIGFVETSAQIILFTQLARDTHYLQYKVDETNNSGVFIENVKYFNAVKSSITDIFDLATRECGPNNDALTAIAKGKSNLALLDGYLIQISSRAH